jgi:hypothetical protein
VLIVDLGLNSPSTLTDYATDGASHSCKREKTGA